MTTATTRRHVHLITPGDHFSARTGSAVSTVVHGLATATPPDQPRPAVLVATGTYPDRYESADAIEYQAVTRRRTDRYLDAALSRLQLPRVLARREYAAALRQQRQWDPAVIFGHNAVWSIPTVDRQRHAAVLYAHNHLLRSYSTVEAGRALVHAAAIVCVSHALADQLAPHLPVALRRRLVVVHNGVDTVEFAPSTETVSDGQLRVTFVGRVVADKGPDIAVRAVRAIDRSDITLTVIGSAGFNPTDPMTAYERELRALAVPLGRRFTAHPFVPRDRVAELLRATDVVVVPSRWPEPFALTALEGMAAGAAVVAARIGGIPEAVGQAGILVPPDDPDALAEALRALADDRVMLARAKANGRTHALAHSWYHTRRELDRVLRPLL